MNISWKRVPDTNDFLNLKPWELKLPHSFPAHGYTWVWVILRSKMQTENVLFWAWAAHAVAQFKAFFRHGLNFREKKKTSSITITLTTRGIHNINICPSVIFISRRLVICPDPSPPWHRIYVSVYYVREKKKNVIFVKQRVYSKNILSWVPTIKK